MKTMGRLSNRWGSDSSYWNDGSQPELGVDLKPQRQQQLFEDCLGFLTKQGQFALSKEIGTLCKGRLVRGQ